MAVLPHGQLRHREGEVQRRRGVVLPPAPPVQPARRQRVACVGERRGQSGLLGFGHGAAGPGDGVPAAGPGRRLHPLLQLGGEAVRLEPPRRVDGHWGVHPVVEARLGRPLGP